MDASVCATTNSRVDSTTSRDAILSERAAALLADDSLWPRSEKGAIELQLQLSGRVRSESFDVAKVSLVAGLDVCYAKDDSRLWAAAVVLDAATWEAVESVVIEGQPHFGYVPGLFAFRELPALIAAIGRLRSRPDVFVCDGAGKAHPRRFGLASHLGVLLDIPTVGSAKTRLFGQHGQVGVQRGDWTPLYASEFNTEIVGRALRTRDNVKPVYVSAGHRMDLDGSTGLILRATPRYRIPEPIRAADHLSGRARAQATDLSEK